MKTINEAMKNLKESKRISLKEANETATFELDWTNEDIANMENNQEKELTLIKNVENTLKTNKIGAKVEIVSIDGSGFGGWPIVKVTGPKEELAKNIGLYYLGDSENDIDYNEIYDTYLESKELDMRKINESDKEKFEQRVTLGNVTRDLYSEDELNLFNVIKNRLHGIEDYVVNFNVDFFGTPRAYVEFSLPDNNTSAFEVVFDTESFGKVNSVKTTYSNQEITTDFSNLAQELYKLKD